jgi:hypothetical protein
MMEVTLKITKSDGRTMPEPSVEVGPVNNVLSSLFESMQMQINDRQITESGRDYPYRCYLNTLLYPSVTRLDSIANGLGIKQNGSSHDADLEALALLSSTNCLMP